MDVSRTLREFCNNATEFEEVRAQQSKIKKPLQETLKISENILKENLEVGSRLRYSMGDINYIIDVKNKHVYQGCDSRVVDKIASLWDNPESLKAGVLESSSADADLSQAILSFVCDSVIDSPTKKIKIEVTETFTESEDVPELPPVYHDAAQALCMSKLDLKSHQASSKEQLSELRMKRSETEKAMALELSNSSETMRKLSLIDNEGNSQSYYLRLKNPRKLPKRKISNKKFRQTLGEIIDTVVSEKSVIESSLNAFCSSQYRDIIVGELRNKLEELELPKAGTGDLRVTLDRVRQPKSAK